MTKTYPIGTRGIYALPEIPQYCKQQKFWVTVKQMLSNGRILLEESSGCLIDTSVDSFTAA